MNIIFKLPLLFLFFFSSICFAEVKEITSEGTYNMGDGETPTVAESRALLQAKRVAVEQAGTYIESYSKIQNFQLTQDEIQVLASGIMEVTILNKKRTVIGDGINFWVKIKARVSTDKIDAMANRVKERMVVEDYKRLQKDYEKGRTEIADLKKRLKEAKSEGERKQVEAKITDEERQFQANALMEIGRIDHFNQKYDIAIDFYNKAISLDPNNALYYLLRGLAFFKKGQSDREIEDLTKGIALFSNKGFIDPFSPDFMIYVDLYTARGLAYIIKGQHARALEDFNKRIALDPNSSDGYSLRGSAYLGLEEFDKAVEDYSKAISLNSNDASNYNARGGVYFRKGQDDKAFEDFNKAISINPNLAPGYANRGRIFAKKKHYDQATQDLNKSIALDDNYAWAYLLRGTVHRLRGETDRAIEDLNKAIALNPEYADAYGTRGAIYASIGYKDRGISDLKKACELGDEVACGTLKEKFGIIASNPYVAKNEAYLCVQRGLELFKKGQLDKAIQEFTKALDLEPRYSTAYYDRGCAYLSKGEPEKAIEDFSIAIAINPKYADAYFNRGLVYGQKAQIDKANADFQKACDFGNEAGCKKVKSISRDR